jgi:thiol-disulfide isomerase/thioredoxin
MVGKQIRTTVILAALAIAVASWVAFAQDSPPSVAYDHLGMELKALNQKANGTNSIDARLQIIREMEAKLLDFRKTYPDSPEATDVLFQLGTLKQGVASFRQDKDTYAEAVKYLAEFIVGAPGEREKLAYAHYYMGESYKGMGMFDDAEKEYRLVADKFNGVNPRLTQFAQMNLSSLEMDRRLAVGKEPIPFSVKGTKGETLSPEMYKGKVLLLDFWATWCGPCKAEMPNVKKVYSKYNSKGFEIVGVSLDRSREALDKYVAQNKIEWPQYFDGKYWNNDIATQYGVKSIPTTFLIDKKGKIRYKSLHGRQLEDAVEQLLAEKM